MEDNFAAPAPKTGEPATRQPVSYLYSKLNFDFIKLMAEIAQYAEKKYGLAENYTASRLDGEKHPMNHIVEHVRMYLAGEKHDKFGDLEHQLAAIAYNAMMEFFYLKKFGPPKPLFDPAGEYSGLVETYTKPEPVSGFERI